ncbi:Engulfment and cell motility [Chamberlinius hualienensis]
MPSMKDGNVVKIAIVTSDDIKTDNPTSSINTQFIEFKQNEPLTVIIEELCRHWEVANPQNYGLKFLDNSTLTGVGRVREDLTNTLLYVNEKNRNDVKNGTVLCLTFSASKLSQDILEVIRKCENSEQAVGSLSRLSKLAADTTFAQEFISQSGLPLLISSIDCGKFQNDSMAYALNSFIMLVEHGNVFWDILEPTFICKIATFINSNVVDAKILKASLAIVECIVVNCVDKYILVEQNIPLASLIKHLQATDVNIQKNSIALINALFAKAEPAKRKSMANTLSSRSIRNIILSNIGSKSGGAEMAHQLYVLQKQLLNQLEELMMTPLDSQNVDWMNKIRELRKIAFDYDETTPQNAKKQSSFAGDYKKLGFQNHLDPAKDFGSTPPGVLALNNMVYFAKYHPEHYTKVVLENSSRSDEHECPFAKTSIQLTKLLCEILEIGEPPTEQGQAFYAMFFNLDYPFEEFFCVCINLLNKTWKEMRATAADFVKVFSVVKEQITRALLSDALSLESFKAKLNMLPYSEITSIWQQERNNREEWVSQAKPIVDLREHITPEILSLIRQQRLNYLVEGSLFTKYSAKGQRLKDKFWYCRLSPNHKILHFGDCNENSSGPSIEQLPNKVSIVEMKSLLNGKECPHMKDSKTKKSTAHLAFSIGLDSEVGSLDFVAPTEQIRDYWIDGISALLGYQMPSEEAKNDLETLLSMDIKLRLLDTEGVKIPKDPPPIPDDPPNYDFYYDFN